MKRDNYTPFLFDGKNQRKLKPTGNGMPYPIRRHHPLMKIIGESGAKGGGAGFLFGGGGG